MTDNAPSNQPVEPGTWEKVVAANPQHAQNYAERFRRMEAEGADLLGEARFVDAMVQRNARILDAGCGPGRHAGYLSARGHDVVGVDLDETLIEIAKVEHPGPVYFAQDLTLLDLAGHGVEAGFDAILCAGNAIAFPAASSRRRILTNLAKALAPEGRAVFGFGQGRGYEFNDFITDAQASGLVLELGLSTWDLKPFREDSNFLVAIFSRA
ncbi:class I SAM-dependent methyltransferase [Luteococcus japonicus]|uniref:Methyltransferase type 11 n=1 Tax=Luteococcus japonicus LSP_Lj1 TaxID=1255658 RepID=A0A1R4I793_9ACTN|nr:class I SAM-dependent methyltransferase [Luteococcus japonicus]SJN15484.1 Methyltransferase type 11 [Luteococcus japonicus LSP_Lj1]